MANEATNNSSPDFSTILSEILSNQELMSKINEVTGSSPQNANSATVPDGSANIDSLLANPDIMSKLPEVISAIKPVISGEKSTGNKTFDKRMGLLVAMKPYLSPKRCEAIDYIARMSKLSETLKGLKL